MKRGEVWTIAGGADYAGKARPAVILQDDRFDTQGSVTVCPMTTRGPETLWIRLPVEPSDTNGLRLPCFLMVDKITTVQRRRCHALVGRLPTTDMVRLNRALAVFLGIAAGRIIARGRSNEDPAPDE